MRPIDADALVRRLKHSPLFLGTNLQFKDGVIDLVERQPTIDVVSREEHKEVKAATVRKLGERLKDRYEFECSADEDNALYYVDLCEWVERIEKELLEENK